MKVFISHAATDTKLANRVARALRTAGLQVWDESLILPGDNWGEKVAEALQESNAMVVLLTPNSLHSPNLTYELGYALGKEDFKNRVVSVIAASPEQLPKGDIPWVLTKFRMVQLPDSETDEEGLKELAQVLQEAA